MHRKNYPSGFWRISARICWNITTCLPINFGRFHIWFKIFENLMKLSYFDQKSASNTGKNIPIDQMPIFLWINFARKLKPDHALFPLVLQKICLQYFWLIRSVDPYVLCAFFGDSLLMFQTNLYNRSLPPCYFGIRCSTILNGKIGEFIDFLHKSAIDCGNKENLTEISQYITWKITVIR